jgi:hypothetical protein
MVVIVMTKPANNGLNVSAAVEDGFTKHTWKMEQITSSRITPPIILHRPIY